MSKWIAIKEYVLIIIFISKINKWKSENEIVKNGFFNIDLNNLFGLNENNDLVKGVCNFEFSINWLIKNKTYWNKFINIKL